MPVPKTYFVFWLLFTVKSEGTFENNQIEVEDTIIPSHVYREPGCPLVPERSGFNPTYVNGDWYLVHASISYFADLGHAILGRYPSVKEIRQLCPSIYVESKLPTFFSNETWTVIWTFPLYRAVRSLRCWPQRQRTKSKFECFFAKENIHSYVMIAATDHASWLLYIGCKIGISVDKPGEGMTWALLSRTRILKPSVTRIIFGVLEGYGFDMLSYNFSYSYDQCPQHQGIVFSFDDLPSYGS